MGAAPEGSLRRGSAELAVVLVLVVAPMAEAGADAGGAMDLIRSVMFWDWEDCCFFTPFFAFCSER